MQQVRNKFFNTSISILQKLSRSYAAICLLVVLLIIWDQNAALSIGFINHANPPKLSKKYFYTSPHGKRLVKRSIIKSNKKIATLKKTKPISAQSLQEMVNDLHTKTIVPGVIYKSYAGALRINILDIDTIKSPILVKPIVAKKGSARLQTVKEYAAASHAIAAINANYFKNTGVPLGTLLINGEWVAGPLYDRAALGIAKSGYMRMDRVSLGGILYTSNEAAPKIWINNVNEPRRTGSHIIAYTSHWGNSVQLPYDGCLVAIDAHGKVINCTKNEIAIPPGGIVLSDTEDSVLSSLKVNDITHLNWKVTPGNWQDVVQAISGGPMLIKDGRFCIDLQVEKFRSNWASNSITARTACGITADNHLLLATIEGPHTIFDLAHVLYSLGAVDAMNLDGGGSTTMVIRNATANIESKSNQRKVAAALGIFYQSDKDNSAAL